MCCRTTTPSVSVSGCSPFRSELICRAGARPGDSCQNYNQTEQSSQDRQLRACASVQQTQPGTRRLMQSFAPSKHKEKHALQCADGELCFALNVPTESRCVFASCSELSVWPAVGHCGNDVRIQQRKEV